MANPAPLRLTLFINADGGQLTATIGGAQNQLNHLGQTGRQAGQQINAGMVAANDSTLALRGALLSVRDTLLPMIGLTAAFFGGKQLIDYADKLQLVDARIKGASSTTADYVLANKALIDVSLSTHSALEGNAQLFTRVNKSVEAMGGSVRNTIAFTDILAKSLKISGTATSEQEGLTRQVAQALASGVLRGDEYNSVMENGARFAYALADGLGVNVGALRAMAEAGLLTTDKVFPALLSQSEKLTAEFNALPVSVSAAFNNVETQFGIYINSANKAHQATSTLSAGVDMLANHLTPVLEGLIIVGEAAALYFAIRGVAALQAFAAAQYQSRLVMQSAAAAEAEQTAISYAHIEALAMNSQATIANLQGQEISTQAARASAAAQLQSAEAEIAHSHATIAATSIMLNSTTAINNRVSAQLNLASAEQRRTVLLAEQSALDARQAALTAELATAESTLTLATQQLTAAQEAQALTSQAGRDAMIANAQVTLQAAEAQLIGAYATQSNINALRPQATASLAAAEADIARAQATLTATQAAVQSTSVLHLRTQAELELVFAEQQRGIASAELAALDARQAVLSAEVTAAQAAQATATRQLTAAQEANALAAAGLGVSFKSLLSVSNLLNAAFAGFMGYQLGEWLNQFSVVADTASKAVEVFAKKSEDRRYSAERNKAILTGNWQDLDQITQAHKANLKAIEDNINGTIAWRSTLEKAGLTVKDYKDLTLSMRSPAEVFIANTRDITLAFNQGLVPLDKYIDRLNVLRTEMDRLNDAKLSEFQKWMAKIKDEQDKVTLSPMQYQIKQIKTQFTNPEEQDAAIAEAGKLLALQEEQKNKQKELTAAKKETQKEEKAAAREAAATAKEYAGLVYQMEKEIALHGDVSHAAALEYDVVNGALDKFSEKQQLKLLQLAAEQDHRNALEKTAAAEKSEMDTLIDKYKQLTLSARDYYRWSLQNKGITGDKAAPLIAQNDKNIGIEDGKKKADDAKKALDSYNQSLTTAQQSMAGLASVSSSVFDAQLGGINTMVGAWGTMTNGIMQNTRAMEELHKMQLLNIASQTKNGELTAEGQTNADKYAKREIQLTAEKTAYELDGARQIAGAAAQMFGEKTAAAKAFHDIEMVLAVASMAMKAKEIALSFTATAVKVQEGAATMFGESGWAGFAGVTAMLAVMASLGYAASGAGSSIAPPPQSSPDTGTVLGDTTAQSQSIGNIVKTLNDIHASEYPQLIGINSGVANLQTSLAGTITTLFQAGGLDTSNRGINLNYQPSSISGILGAGLGVGSIGGVLGGGLAAASAGSAAGIMAGLSVSALSGAGLVVAIPLLINALFSGGYKSVVERGIQTTTQNLGSLANGDPLTAQQYNVVKTRTWDLFGDSTRYDTIFTNLDAKVIKSLGQVFQSAGQVSLSLAEQLGGNLAAKVKGYVIPSLKIDLTGLNADDASKKINAVLSTALDTMATDIFGGLVGKYQQIGEGMLETATRIVSEMAVVGDALHQSGLSMGSDAMAISDELAQAAGGLKAFQDQFATFYDKFYTDTEKQARLQATLSGQLQSVFLGLPDTRAGYRDLIEALNLSNAKDRERYSLLIKLAGSADTYYTSLENGLKTYQDGVKSSYDTAANLLKGQVDTYRNFVTQLKGFSDSLVTGALSNANPIDKYQSAKSAYLSVKSVLASGTDAQKETALGQLQSVTQAYLEASKSYNASGMGYVKDFADAQALLTKAISSSAGKADVAQAQLDQLTAQVSALGLINQSVLSVKDAVDAFSAAMVGLQKAQEAQALLAADNKNRAAFGAIESGRKAAYEAPIATRAAAVGAAAQKSEGMLGWSDNTSKSAFSAEAVISSATGAVVSGESYQSSSGHAGDVVNSLRTGGFENVRAQFAYIGKTIEALVGGTLPDIYVKLAGGGGNGKAMYTFAGQSRSVQGDDIDPLVRLFANDATDYLADHLGNAAWANQIKAVSFASLNSGFSELSALMAHLKHPYQASTYNDKVDYSKLDGSHRDGLESVPFDGYVAELHKGERVLTAQESVDYAASQSVSVVFARPVWLDELLRNPVAPVKADAAGEDKSAKTLELCLAELRKLNKLAAESVAVERTGFLRAIAALEAQIELMQQANRQNLRVVREK